VTRIRISKISYYLIDENIPAAATSISLTGKASFDQGLAQRKRKSRNETPLKIVAKQFEGAELNSCTCDLDGAKAGALNLEVLATMQQNFM